jgi:hypothetical protein
MPLKQLSRVLWQERELVGQVVEGRASRAALHAAELTRALVVHTLVQTLDLDDAVTLRDLADALPNPWGDVFGSHHAALSANGCDALPRSLVDFLG